MRRRAIGIHVKISEADRFGMQTVIMRRLYNRIPVTGKIVVTLVVGEDHDYVRSGPFLGIREIGKSQANREEK